MNSNQDYEQNIRATMESVLKSSRLKYRQSALQLKTIDREMRSLEDKLITLSEQKADESFLKEIIQKLSILSERYNKVFRTAKLTPDQVLDEIKAIDTK